MVLHHALLTSHHRLSSTKRRTMANLSSEHSLSGFAKLGYPGVIYCYCYTVPTDVPNDTTEGSEGSISRTRKNNARMLKQHVESIEFFVRTVKAMNWLALRVRFVEDVPLGSIEDLKKTDNAGITTEAQRVADYLEAKPGWVEYEKVGEVVEYMRKLGREKLLFDLGIGSSAS